MRLPTARRSAIVAMALLATTLGFGWAHATAAGGGLSITPGIFEHAAQPGGLGAVTISNTTRVPMTVAVTPRPWQQSRSGAVAADRRHTLGKVRINPSSFGLAPGATRSVGVSLSRQPAHGSIFGALEVTGKPKRRGGGGSGVKVAYRLISSLRLFPRPGTQVLSARAGRLIERGTTRSGALLLEVRNTGNTIIPIGGTVDLRGRGHSLSGNATPKKVLPGATVNLPLTRLQDTLRPGRYDVSVHLTQGGHPIGKVTRRGVLLR